HPIYVHPRYAVRRCLHSFPTRRSSDLWVARYTLAQPGMVLRGVLRSHEALSPPKPITALRLVGPEPERMTEARLRVLDEMADGRSEEHTSELQSRANLVCRLLLETKNI